jgi:hypothetical protein
LTVVALRLGPLEVEGFTVERSGLRWLRQDGDLCRRGEAIGYCNIGLRQKRKQPGSTMPFGNEARDLQMAFATPIPGRLRRRSALTLGGFQNFQFVAFWNPDEIVAHIEPEGGPSPGASYCDARLLMMAGRRMTDLAEVRSGLLTGWHRRSRGCRIEGKGPIGTLLGLGLCEIEGVIRGESRAFLEILESIEGPAQLVFVPSTVLVPCARVVSEQIRRGPAEYAAILNDFVESLACGAVTPDAGDWIFAGALLRTLGASPATERYVMLTRDGLRETGPPDAIVLSLSAEYPTILRHRTLGYALHLLDFRVASAGGTAFSSWLRANFELVNRSVEDIHADYLALIDLIRAQAPKTQVLINNMMSTSGQEDIQTYGSFDAPLEARLDSVRAKDLNLMLCDLARERDIAIIDTDAIAAEFGGRLSLPDGVHQNGAMQSEMRAEILHILRTRRVPGFASPLNLVN